MKGQPCYIVGHKVKSLTAKGYRLRQTNRGRVPEHVLVAERALGKRLPADADVHHVDGTKRNNQNSNLVICQDRAYHMLLHVRARILKAGGNPNTDKLCCICKRPRPRDTFSPQTNGSMGLSARCRECASRYQRTRLAAMRRSTLSCYHLTHEGV